MPTNKLEEIVKSDDWGHLKAYSDIQGDSGGICITLGNDSMSDSKQKIHTNMGPILNGYGVMGIF